MVEGTGVWRNSGTCRSRPCGCPRVAEDLSSHPWVHCSFCFSLYLTIPLGHRVCLRPSRLGQPYARHLSFHGGLPIFLSSSSTIGYWLCLQHKGRKKVSAWEQRQLFGCPISAERRVQSLACASGGDAHSQRPWKEHSIVKPAPGESDGQGTHALKGLIVFTAYWGVTTDCLEP